MAKTKTNKKANVFNVKEPLFKYNRKDTPFDNYIKFQQGISFENGVEFISDLQDKNSPILYLLSDPSLDIDPADAENNLRKFNIDVIKHLEEVMNTEKDSFECFSVFHNLYRMVELNHMDYAKGNDKFFAEVKVLEYPVKFLKEMNQPIIRGNYRGFFLNKFNGEPKVIEYSQLDDNLKRHISSLYLVKRKCHTSLFNELKKIKAIYFNKRKIINYQYSGKPSDIVEVALALLQSKRIQTRRTDKTTHNHFISDFCSFMGVHFSQLRNYMPTLNDRNTKEKLFIQNELLNSLTNMLKHEK